MTRGPTAGGNDQSSAAPIDSVGTRIDGSWEVRSSVVENAYGSVEGP